MASSKSPARDQIESQARIRRAADRAELFPTSPAPVQTEPRETGSWRRAATRAGKKPLPTPIDQEVHRALRHLAIDQI